MQSGHTARGEFNMKIVGVQLIAEGSGTGGYTVEFVDAAGSVVAVRFAADADHVNRTNAVQQAKAFLHRLVDEDLLPDEMAEGRNQDGRAATVAESFYSVKQSG